MSLLIASRSETCAVLSRIDLRLFCRGSNRGSSAEAEPWHSVYSLCLHKRRHDMLCLCVCLFVLCLFVLCVCLFVLCLFVLCVCLFVLCLFVLCVCLFVLCLFVLCVCFVFVRFVCLFACLFVCLLFPAERKLCGSWGEAFFVCSCWG